MQPAAKKAPLDFLFALVISLCPLVLSFFVQPDTTRWIVFAVGVVMTLSVLAAALRPVKDQQPNT
ncbi:MAG: hypothetical protein ACRDZY_19670 [Acidimicrobiales bacterium]